MKTNTNKLRRALTAFVLTGAVMPIADLCAQVTVLDTNGTQIAAGTSLNAVQDSLNGNTAIISSDIVEPGNLKIVYTSGSPDANLNPVFTVKSDTPGTWRTIDLNNKNRLIFHNVKEDVPGMVNFHGEDIIIKNGFGEFGQKGGFIAAERGVKLTGNMQFLNISAAANSVICTYGGGVEVDGNFVFDGNKATDDSGAIFRVAYRSGYEVPDLVIRGSNVFTNNYAVDGDVIATFTGNSCNAIIEGTNVFNYNSADRGTAVIESPNNFTISGNNQFNNNTVYGIKNTGPGVAYHDGSVIAGTTITISGTTEFKNNTIAGKYGAGAIYTSSSVYFTGDGSTAVFEGNTFENVEKGLAPVRNDISGSFNGSNFLGYVSFADAGTYSFDGGINVFTLQVDEAAVTMKSGASSSVKNMPLSNGANVTFEKGTQTDISGTLTLDGATLNIATDGTEKTKFEVGSITDKGGNTLNIDYSGTENGTVISGDTTGLKTRPEVEYTALQDGEYGYVSSSTNKGMNVTVSETDKTYVRLSTNGETAWADSATADNLADLGTVGADDEIVVTAAPAAKTAGLTANGALSFRSNNTTARTIESNGSTLVSGASDLTLNNVTLKSNSSENAVVKGDSVNLTGKGTAGISAPKAIESTNGVTLDGKLTVDGAITGNTTIADGADVTVTQRTDVSGALNVGDAKVTIDGLGMTWVDHEDKDGNVSKVPQVDRIDVTDAISFAKDAVIEISFDETFNLDAPGTYEIMKGKSLVDKGAEFSFVDAIAQLNNDMLQLSVVDGALMLDVKGFGTVPEPSTWALLVLGGLGVFGVARKNRKAKK